VRRRRVTGADPEPRRKRQESRFHADYHLRQEPEQAEHAVGRGHTQARGRRRHHDQCQPEADRDEQRHAGASGVQDREVNTRCTGRFQRR